MNHSTESLRSSPLIAALVSRHRVTYFVFILLIFMGGMTLMNASREGMPNIELPYSVVAVTMPGATPSDIDRVAIIPLYDNLKGLEGIKKITSKANRSRGIVFLEYEQGTDMTEAYNDLRSEVESIKATLPADAEVSTLKISAQDMNPLIEATLSGKDPKVLFDVAQDIEDAAEGDKGVEGVDVGGSRVKSILVMLDPQKLQSYGFSLSEIKDAIVRGDALLSSGTFDIGSGRLPASISGSLDGVKDITGLPLRVEDNGTVVRLGDVATVSHGYLPQMTKSYYNGTPTLSLTFHQQSGQNIIEAANRIKTLLAEKSKENGLEYRVTLDTGKETNNMFVSLLNTVIFASILVLICTLAAIGLRSGLLVGMLIPASIAIAVTVVTAFGISLNMVVLFGFIMTAGMIVDAGIVLVEYAERKVEEGAAYKDAYIDAYLFMFSPIVSGMMTTVAVYLPLLFWPGIAGEFMRYLIMTVPLTLSISVVIVFTLLPTIGARLKKTPGQIEALKARQEAQKQGRLQENEASHGFFTRWYGRILKVAIGNPFKTLLVSFLMVGLILGIFMRFSRGVNFFPETDPDSINMRIYSQSSYSLDQIEAMTQDIQAQLLKYPEFAHIVFNQDASGKTSGGRSGLIASASLVLAKGKTSSVDSVKSRMDKVFNEKKYPGLSFALVPMSTAGNPGPPRSSDVEFVLSAPTPDLASKAADKLKNWMELQKGVFARISNDVAKGQIEMSFELNRDNLKYYGVSLLEVSHWIKLYTHGGLKLMDDYIPKGDRNKIDIVAFYPKGEQLKWNNLLTMMIPTRRGETSLGKFVTPSYRAKENRIAREDGHVVNYVRADMAQEKGFSPSQGMKLVMDAINHPTHPLFDPKEDVHIKLGGDSADQAETAAFLEIAFLIGVGLIVIILLMQYNNWYLVLLIAAAIFFAVFGGLLGVVASKDRILSVVMFGLAVLSLAGVVVNNNIVLISHFLDLLKQGLSKKEAAYMAGMDRFRPVNLTAWTTIAGLVPSILLLSVDVFHFDVEYNASTGQIWVQLARVTAFGLAFATLITLILTPSLLPYYKTEEERGLRPSWLTRFSQALQNLGTKAR